MGGDGAGARAREREVTSAMPRPQAVVCDQMHGQWKTTAAIAEMLALADVAGLQPL